VPSDEFLNELRDQFERLIGIKERLDNKANNIITMSGTIITLLMGIGIFVLKSIDPKTSIFCVLLLLFIVGISLMIVTIILSINSYKLRNQKYPLGSKEFFKNGIYQKIIADKFSNASKPLFEEKMIKGYLSSIRDAEKKISEKGRSVKWAQVFFLAGMLTLPIILLIYIYEFGNIPYAG